jgi:signal transduction histidine kinase
VLAAVQVVASSGPRAADSALRPLDAIGYALLLAGPAALLWRSRRPLAVLVVVTAVTTGYFVLGYPFGPGFLAMVVALFAAVRSGRRTAAWVAAGAAYLCYVGAGRLLGSAELVRPPLAGAVGIGAWLLVTLAFAEAVRVRSAHFAEVSRARAEAARAQAEQRRRQESEERLRMARELHDALGHHLSLISVQAGVGLHLMDTRPEQARAALTAIKQASAEALREVRNVLGVLRPEDESAPRTPAPSLSSLDALIEDVTGAGLPVHLTVEGDRMPLPAEVDRAAYRIVQEALTNVRRHAGPAAAAAVVIRFCPEEVQIEVRDNGVGAVSGGEETGPGTGIPGMRQRAAALGGELSAGPGAPAGFVVTARLPLRTRPTRERS